MSEFYAFDVDCSFYGGSIVIARSKQEAIDFYIGERDLEGHRYPDIERIEDGQEIKMCYESVKQRYATHGVKNSKVYTDHEEVEEAPYMRVASARSWCNFFNKTKFLAEWFYDI